MKRSCRWRRCMPSLGDSGATWLMQLCLMTSRLSGKRRNYWPAEKSSFSVKHPTLQRKSKVSGPKLTALEQAVSADFPLTDADSARLRAELKERILAIYAKERAAHEALGALVS